MYDCCPPSSFQPVWQAADHWQHTFPNMVYGKLWQWKSGSCISNLKRLTAAPRVESVQRARHGASSSPYLRSHAILITQDLQFTRTLAAIVIGMEGPTPMTNGRSLRAFCAVVDFPLLNVLWLPETEATPSSPCSGTANAGWDPWRMSQR